MYILWRASGELEPNRGRRGPQRPRRAGEAAGTGGGRAGGGKAARVETQSDFGDPRSTPRTTSGKVRRYAVRRKYIEKGIGTNGSKREESSNL